MEYTGKAGTVMGRYEGETSAANTPCKTSPLKRITDLQDDASSLLSGLVSRAEALASHLAGAEPKRPDGAEIEAPPAVGWFEQRIQSLRGLNRQLSALNGALSRLERSTQP